MHFFLIKEALPGACPRPVMGNLTFCSLVLLLSTSDIISSLYGVTIVLKTGSGQPVRPVQLGTGHSPGPIFTKDLIALLMRSTPVEPVDSLSNR